MLELLARSTGDHRSQQEPISYKYSQGARPLHGLRSYCPRWDVQTRSCSSVRYPRLVPPLSQDAPQPSCDGTARESAPSLHMCSKAQRPTHKPPHQVVLPPSLPPPTRFSTPPQSYRPRQSSFAARSRRSSCHRPRSLESLLPVKHSGRHNRVQWRYLDLSIERCGHRRRRLVAPRRSGLDGRGLRRRIISVNDACASATQSRTYKLYTQDLFVKG